MPAASAIEFAGGDVEHLAPTAGLDYRTVSNSTRELAYRDNMLAAKVNELITVVNNKEQIIALPTVRTTLSPGEVLVATNYRIPNGFEARVLNAAVATTPEQAVLLEILYSQDTFGASDGVSLVSTYTEASATTSFNGTGELIVRLSNVTANPADTTASIFFTLRPSADQAGGVIGPGVKGEKGDPGPTGADGAEGVPGPPGPAASSLAWSAITSTPTTAVGYGIVGGAQLDSFGGLSGTGMVSRTGVNTFSVRVLTPGSTNITISDGDGVAANPTIDLGTSVSTGTVMATIISAGSLLTVSRGLGLNVATVVTANGTTTLTSGSQSFYVFTGTDNQTVVYPSAIIYGTGVAPVYILKNRSSGSLTLSSITGDTFEGAPNYTVASNATARTASNGSNEWELI